MSAPKVSTGFDRWLARALIARLGDPAISLVLWDGARVPDRAGIGRVRISDRRTLLALAHSGELGFGDAFSEGRLEVEGDLSRVLCEIYAASERRGGRARLAAPWRVRVRSGSRRSARGNVHRHYDLGNDFYKLWLDPELVYTCAYFPTPGASLETAQRAKLEYVCRKLRLLPGERVVEAGCGWGALALYMAERWKVDVTAYNISREQIAFARERAQQRGLADRVRFVLGDYRDIRGEYDAFVSVGMLEHVGRAHYRELGARIDACLAPHGRGLIHSIGRSQALPMNAWIERRIFPGSYCPTLREICGLLEPFAFEVADVDNLRPHYARTLAHWLERFEKHALEIEARFGAPFVRAWRLYLAGSIAAFRSGGFQLFQLLFARPLREPLWSREDLYASPLPRDPERACAA
jgi:cyclopropane-fatty-acyl-phospholipid synthase